MAESRHPLPNTPPEHRELTDEKAKSLLPPRNSYVSLDLDVGFDRLAESASLPEAIQRAIQKSVDDAVREALKSVRLEQRSVADVDETEDDTRLFGTHLREAWHALTGR